MNVYITVSGQSVGGTVGGKVGGTVGVCRSQWLTDSEPFYIGQSVSLIDSLYQNLSWTVCFCHRCFVPFMDLKINSLITRFSR